jgi:hypothetical protein
VLSESGRRNWGIEVSTSGCVFTLGVVTLLI